MSNNNDGLDREVYDDATVDEILQAREWGAQIDGEPVMMASEEQTPPRRKPIRVIHPPPPDQEEFWHPPPSDSDSASASEPGIDFYFNSTVLCT